MSVAASGQVSRGGGATAAAERPAGPSAAGRSGRARAADRVEVPGRAAAAGRGRGRRPASGTGRRRPAGRKGETTTSDADASADTGPGDATAPQGQEQAQAPALSREPTPDGCETFGADAHVAFRRFPWRVACMDGGPGSGDCTDTKAGSSARTDREPEQPRQALATCWRRCWPSSPRHRPDDDTAMIVEAGRTAPTAHEGQFRRSGEPYITHPVAVATIVAELGLDAQTVAGALLHDAVEDTGLTLETIEETFGDGVARVVDGVTKLDRLQFNSKEAQQAATIRKMLVAMADDWRVLLIKLADRLHNMRTLAVMPEWKQRRTAQETFDVYAPLAHRLGVQQVRWQLEDLAFATLHPKRYAEIEQMVAARAPQREEYLERVLVHVRQRLEDMGIEADVTGRPKHLWSIYEKMVVRGKEFDDINDLVGHPGRRRVREGLLGRPRRHPRHLGAGARALQGLHQHAQVQHVPVAAHDGHRARRQAGRGADPHLGDAPPGRVRHRGALGLQVQGGPLLGDGVAAAHRRRRPPDRRPDRVPRGAQARPRAGRGLRLHAQGQGDRAAGPLDARSTSPTPSTPRWGTAASAPGSTAASCRSRPSSVSADTVEIFTSKSPTAGPSRDWLQIVASTRARNKIRQWFSPGAP